MTTVTVPVALILDNITPLTDDVILSHAHRMVNMLDEYIHHNKKKVSALAENSENN